MKNLLLIFVIALMQLPIFAQTTKELFSTPGYENLMVSVPSTPDNSPDGNLSLYFEKDSIACGEPMLVYDTEHQGRILINIIEGQVWAVHDCDNRKLVMDFDLVVGDTITHLNLVREVLTVGDTILQDGINRKTYRVSAPPNVTPSSELFIEGIGSLFYGLNYLPAGAEYTTYLSCIQDNNSQIYLSEFANPIICELFTRLITSTTEISDLNLRINPNPSSGIFTITHDLANTLKANIYSSLGEIILSIDEVSRNHEIDLSSLSKGQYFLRVMTEEGKNQVYHLILF